MKISKLLAEVHPVSVEVEWVPISVGALFKMIGTPVVRNYNQFLYLMCVSLFNPTCEYVLLVRLFFIHFLFGLRWG